MSVSEKVRKTPLGVMCIECPFRALSKPPAMPVVMTRKDKALAETAALLVLEKKIQSLWSKPEAEKLTCRSARK